MFRIVLHDAAFIQYTKNKTNEYKIRQITKGKFTGKGVFTAKHHNNDCAQNGEHGEHIKF